MFNKSVFYSRVRKSIFGGSLSQDQVEGMGKILDYWEQKYSHEDIRWLAYALATIFHETWRTMQPIEEKGGLAYLKKKPYYPWHGRGLVQITWKANYEKYGIDFPEDALKWDVALHVTFDGMVFGRFTGRKLVNYFNGSLEDPVRARRIINGNDKATLIAGYYAKFKDALITSKDIAYA